MSEHEKTCSKPKFGIIDESMHPRRYPREVDDTFYTLDEATAAAMSVLQSGVQHADVTVCLVEYNKHGTAVETMTSVALSVKGNFDDLQDD